MLTLLMKILIKVGLTTHLDKFRHKNHNLDFKRPKFWLFLIQKPKILTYFGLTLQFDKFRPK